MLFGLKYGHFFKYAANTAGNARKSRNSGARQPFHELSVLYDRSTLMRILGEYRNTLRAATCIRYPREQTYLDAEKSPKEARSVLRNE